MNSNMDRFASVLMTFWLEIERVSKKQFVRIIFNLLAFGFISYLLIKNYSSFKLLVQDRTISYNYFFLAFVIILFVVIFIGGTSWHLINLGLGQKISWIDALRVQLFSNISKYIPGTIWQFASKARLSSRLGIGTKPFSMAIIFELGQTLWIGFCIILLFIPVRLGGLNIPELVRQIGIVAGIIGIVFSFTFPFWGKIILLKFPGQVIDIKSTYLTLSSIVILIGWVLSVFSFWCISLGLESSKFSSISNFFFTYASSLVGGILVIPVPNGIGIREGIMVIALQNNLPEALSIILAGISRIEISLAEVLGFVFVWIGRKIFPPSPKIENDQIDN